MTKAGVIQQQSHTRSIVYCALSIALMAVCAWVTIPFGPVPFTLQTMAVMFALFALTPKQALVSIGGYLLLGAIGLPVFSSFRGGLSALMGPTGGFLIGFIVGAALALPLMYALKNVSAFSNTTKRKFFGFEIETGRLCRNLVMGIVFMAVSYVFGWAWLMIVGNLSAEAAFLAAVAPFILIDALKMIAAVLLAQAVGSALK